MDKDLIDRVKRYAAEKETSLSKMVASYFRLVVTSEQVRSDGENEDWKADLGPLTRSLVGLAEGAELTEDDYRRHLAEKHR